MKNIIIWCCLLVLGAAFCVLAFQYHNLDLEEQRDAREIGTLRYVLYLQDNYVFECEDDAYTIALYLRGEDTTHSEVIDRYQSLINNEIEENQ